MIVLRFSPVSSGLFSFRMSNTRSAGQAHPCEQYADTDSWPTLSASFSATDTDFKDMATPMCHQLRKAITEPTCRHNYKVRCTVILVHQG